MEPGPRPRSAIRPVALLAPAALLLAAAAAAADTFQMKDGTVVEGEVLRTFRDDRDDRLVDRWEVRTIRGVRILPAVEVRSHREARPTDPPYPWRKFEIDFAAVDPANAWENWFLGDWARRQGLEAEAVRAFRRALAADPDFVKARTALGHQRVDGKWIVPPGQESAPDDRGAALPPGDPTALETLLGRAFARRESENFRVESTCLDQPSLGRLLTALERAREDTLAFLADPPPVGARKATFLVLRADAEYARAVETLVRPSLDREPDRAAADRRLALYRASRLAPLPEGSGCVALRSAEGETADHAFLCHFAVHLTWASVTAPGVREPDWLREAVAYAVLNEAYPDDPTWCVAATYGRRERVPMAWRNTRTWEATARALAVSSRALAFRDLAVLDLNSLTFDALVQSWSVLAVLRAKDESGTRSFLRRVRRGTEPFQALKEALRLDPAAVDALWRAEVLKAR